MLKGLRCQLLQQLGRAKKIGFENELRDQIIKKKKEYGRYEEASHWGGGAKE